MTDQAVLLMAYGTPRDIDDVEAYYTHIRRGRPPTPEALEELKDRYRAIGGRSPLLEITQAQAEGLEERLSIPVRVGQKHAPPFIHDAFEELATQGARSVLGLVLAPHYSTMSIGDYERRARAAVAEIGWQGTFEMVESWHLAPGYIDLMTARVKAAGARLPLEGSADVPYVFTAHSLPVSILKDGDPYADQLAETAASIARAAGLSQWRIGWQSAGRTEQEWLRPDVLELIDDYASSGAAGIVVCPCGFVADHLEVLYDLDVEARGHAEKLGLAFERTESPNADPAFLDTLADVARDALSQPA